MTKRSKILKKLAKSTPVLLGISVGFFNHIRLISMRPRKESIHLMKLRKNAFYAGVTLSENTRPYYMNNHTSSWQNVSGPGYVTVLPSRTMEIK